MIDAAAHQPQKEGEVDEGRNDNLPALRASAKHREAVEAYSKVRGLQESDGAPMIPLSELQRVAEGGALMPTLAEVIKQWPHQPRYAYVGSECVSGCHKCAIERWMREQLELVEPDGLMAGDYFRERVLGVEEE